MSGDLQAQGIGRGDLDILYMFRTFCKGFKIILDVVQVEKQRKSLVWNRYLLWHASCKRVSPRTSTLWIVMWLILRTSHDLQMATSHKAYPETSEPKRLKKSKQKQHKRMLKQTLTEVAQPEPLSPIGHLYISKRSASSQGAKKGTIIHCLFACILPTSTIMFQIGQQAPPHPKHYHLQ